MNVTVIGKGYVGEQVGAAFEASGHSVRFYDPPKGLNGLRGDQDVYIICVPTPLAGTGAPDHRHVEHAVGALRQAFDGAGRLDSALVVLESTVAPGATRAILGEGLRGHRIAFSPERVDPGSNRDTQEIPKLVAGIDAESLDAAMALYRRAFHWPVECPSLEVAELAKLHENAYRAVNIALVDELAELCRAIDINPSDVLDAAATKPFGFQRFNPGAGPGGHCIPVDPAYLLHTADGESVRMRTLEAAHVRNTMAASRNVDRVVQAMGKLTGKVAVLGLTYKPGVADCRNSAGYLLAKKLQEHYHVAACDPLVSKDFVHPLSRTIEWADLLVVCTPHPEYLNLRNETDTPVLDLTGQLHPAEQADARAAA